MTTEQAIKSLENIVEYWSCKPTEQQAAELAITALKEQQEQGVMCDRYRDGKCISRYCYYLSAGGTCLNPKMKPKPTNADRIRSMSDKELAELILECHHAGYADDTITGDHNVDIMDWLQQPVEVVNSD